MKRVSCLVKGRYCAMTSSHRVRLNRPKEWKCTSTPFLSLNMPTCCFRTGLVVSRIRYCVSKRTAVWLADAFSHGCTETAA